MKGNRLWIKYVLTVFNPTETLPKLKVYKAFILRPGVMYCRVKSCAPYKSSFTIYSETPFTKILYHIETSSLKRFAILLTDFYMIIDFSERYFRTDFNDIFSLSVVIIANFKRIQIIRKEVWALTLNKSLSLKC